MALATAVAGLAITFGTGDTPALWLRLIAWLRLTGLMRMAVASVFNAFNHIRKLLQIQRITGFAVGDFQGVGQDGFVGELVQA